jgi:hypothetical protein
MFSLNRKQAQDILSPIVWQLKSIHAFKTFADVALNCVEVVGLGKDLD